MIKPEENTRFQEDVQEQISWLAEDVIDLDERQDLSFDFIHQLSEWCLGMLDVIRSNRYDIDVLDEKMRKAEENIDDLEGEFKFHDTTILVLFIVFLIWNLILTYNVFF